MDEKQLKCQKGWLIFTLVLSIISFSMSTFLAVKLGVFEPDGKIYQPNTEVKISQKYDKGQSFEKALENKKPILIWFYTDWCGYCKKFAPTFVKLAKDKKVKENFAIAYVNCDDETNHKIMQEYKIQGFPTLFLRSPEGIKKQIEPESLFAPNAIDEIKDELFDFIKKD